MTSRNYESWDSLDGMHVPISAHQSVPARVDEVRVGDERTAGLVPDIPGGSRHPAAFDLMGAPNFFEDLVRSKPQSAIAALPIDPITTRLVVGPAVQRSAWVDLFFPRAMVFDAGDSSLLARTEKVQYARWGNTHLGNYDTRLGERQPFQLSGQAMVWLTAEIETHGWATDMTDVEKARAVRQIGWAEKKAMLPMWILERRMQFKAAEMLVDTTAGRSFALGHVLNKGAGTEWDEPGVDMLDDCALGIQTVASATGYDNEQITVVFTRASWNAALKNDAFRAHHAGVTMVSRDDTNLSAQRMKEFLGVGDVQVINPTGDGIPLFGDEVWILTQGPISGDWDTSYGHERYGARLGVNDGFVLDPWTERMIRTDIFAAMKEYILEILNPRAGFLITNTSKVV